MQSVLDKCERLVSEAIYATAILGNLESNEFELVDLTPLSEDRTRRLLQRNMSFVGAIGIVNGLPRVSLEIPLSEATMSALTHVFLKRIETAIILIEQAASGGVN